MSLHCLCIQPPEGDELVLCVLVLLRARRDWGGSSGPTARGQAADLLYDDCLLLFELLIA